MSIRLNQVGNKAGRIMASVRNGETSASIPRGTPVILKLSTTADNPNDGLMVVLPATAGNVNSYGLKYGILVETIAAGVFSESILFGNCGYTLITRATRAASSDSWTSSASIASGVGLGIDTINNACLVGASIAASIASNNMPLIMLDSVASMAASATATSDTRTVITAAVRSFVRMM
jgi:hypothetical protein